MKSLVLHRAVLRHQAKLCNVSLERDVVTLENRYGSEGDHFSEVVLPRLDDALTYGLKYGVLPLVEGFAFSGDLPIFLRPLWEQVFDVDGLLLEDANASAILAIRQISRLHKKIFEVCSPEAEAKEVQNFLSTDAEVGSYELPDALHVRRAIRALYGRVLASTDWSVVDGRHGPGAVAEKLDAVARWDFGPTNPEITEVFPDPYPQVYSFPLPECEGSPKGRLVAVPKTAVKPRLISIEPVGHQFIQQSIKDVLYRAFERIPMVSLSSQEPNRVLAEIGSHSGDLATLDLSEASDRLSYDFVMDSFRDFPGFRRAIDACRTRVISVEGHGDVELKKFASMGSALTFPLQVMLFSSITCAAIALEEGGEFGRTVRSLAYSGFLRVYGDDIIVPAEHYRPVVAGLEAFGLKVNNLKSFSTGLFRESCGADFYSGHDVTPVYRRRRDPEGRHSTSEVVSLISFANQYHDRYGHSPIPDLVHEWLRARTGINFTRHPNPSEFGGLSVVGALDGPRRYNVALQREEVRSYALRASNKKHSASERAQLLYALDSVRGSVCPDDSEVLSSPGILIPGRTLSYGVSASTHIKARWVPA